MSTLANSDSFFKTQLCLCLLLLTTKMGLPPVFRAQCMSLSHQPLILGCNHFFCQAPLVGVLGIFTAPATTCLLNGWKKSMERRKLYCSWKVLIFGQIDITSSSLVWLNTLGLGSHDSSQFPWPYVNLRSLHSWVTDSRAQLLGKCAYLIISDKALSFMEAGSLLRASQNCTYYPWAFNVLEILIH